MVIPAAAGRVPPMFVHDASISGSGKGLPLTLSLIPAGSRPRSLKLPGDGDEPARP